MLVYKVVNSSYCPPINGEKGGYKYSSTMGLAHPMIVEYKPGIFNVNLQCPFLAFDNLEDAVNFRYKFPSYGFAVWKAWAYGVTHPTRVIWSVWGTKTSDEVREFFLKFWKGELSKDKEHYALPPKGTVACQAIKLIKMANY